MNRTLRIRQYLQFLHFTPYDTSTEIGRSHERYRLIALSSFSSLVSKVVTSVIGLISIPFTIDYLGKEQFGLWMVASSLVVWAQLADFGISNGLVNALAEAHGRNDRDVAISYISTAFFSLALIAFLCIPPLVILSNWIPWDLIFSMKNQELVPLAGKCFLAAGIVFLLSFPFSVINKIFVANQIGYVANLTQVISSLCTLVGLLVAIYFRFSLPWLVVFVSSGPLLGNLIAWSFLSRFLPWCGVDFKSFNVSAWKRIAHSSIPLFLFQIGALLVNEMMNIVIARASDLRMVADYNILLRIYLFIFALGVSFASPFYPAIREAYERKEIAWVARAVSRVSVIRIFAILFPCLILVFSGDWIISIWIKQPLDGRLGLSGWSIFSLCLIFSAMSSTLGEILTSLDDIWSQIKIVFLSSVIVLGGIYYLIPIYQLSGIYVSILLSTIYPIYWSMKRIKVTIAGNLS